MNAFDRFCYNVGYGVGKGSHAVVRGTGKAIAGAGTGGAMLAQGTVDGWAGAQPVTTTEADEPSRESIREAAGLPLHALSA